MPAMQAPRPAHLPHVTLRRLVQVAAGQWLPISVRRAASWLRAPAQGMPRPACRPSDERSRGDTARRSPAGPVNSVACAAELCKAAARRGHGHRGCHQRYLEPGALPGRRPLRRLRRRARCGHGRPGSAADTPPGRAGHARHRRAVPARLRRRRSHAEEAALKSTPAQRGQAGSRWPPSCACGAATTSRTRPAARSADAGPALCIRRRLPGREHRPARRLRRAARRALQQPARRAPRWRRPRHAGTRQWLLTSVAEIEELAGRPAARPTPPTGKAMDAQALGLPAPRLQRLPSAARAGMPRSPRCSPTNRAAMPCCCAWPSRPPPRATRLSRPTPRSMRTPTNCGQRFSRPPPCGPAPPPLHAREEAHVRARRAGRRPEGALALARLNVRLQREPIDLLLFARAAIAAARE
jgi:hypothetical protein